MSKYRTTKLFALQTADYDGHFHTRRQRDTSRLERLFQILVLLPAVVLFLTPSFKIGRLVWRAPDFAIPDTASQGSVFTVPIEADFQSVQLEGQTLPEVKIKTPLYLATVNTTEPIMDFVLMYKSPDTQISLKSLLPKFDHPSYSVYTKMIRVQAPTEEAVAEAKAKNAKPPIPLDPKVFSRNDGLVTAACWKQPFLEEIPQLGVRQGRRPGPKMATLSSAGSGEVVHVGFTNGTGPEKSVIVYHGGGLFSRYHGVKDYRARRGDRISAGQPIAVVEALGPGRKPASPHWDLHMNQTEVNRESFLALSSQLCDLK